MFLGLVPFEEGLDGEVAEIGESTLQRSMAPVPPGERLQPLRDILGKAPLDKAGRIAGNDRLGSDILGDDRAGRHHRARANVPSGQDDRAMADPDIVAELDAMGSPPIEE